MRGIQKSRQNWQIIHNDSQKTVRGARAVALYEGPLAALEMTFCPHKAHILSRVVLNNHSLPLSCLAHDTVPLNAARQESVRDAEELRQVIMACAAAARQGATLLASRDMPMMTLLLEQEIRKDYLSTHDKNHARRTAASMRAAEALSNTDYMGVIENLAPYWHELNDIDMRRLAFARHALEQALVAAR